MSAALLSDHYGVRVWGADRDLAFELVAFAPDLVIIDLANVDALSHATESPSRGSAPPLVLCGVDGSAAERIHALESGADACIAKSSTTEELRVHVHAMLRRAPRLRHTVHHLGRLVVDVAAHTTTFDGVPIHLPAKEFDILAILAAHAGAVLSKATLLERIWGFEAYDENLVEVHMSALRRRLPPECRPLITTVRGVGYVLRVDIPQVGRS